MLNSNTASACATALSLALLGSFVGTDPAAAQERLLRLPSSFDLFFADVGRPAPLFTRSEVVGQLPPLPAVTEESGPTATASVEPPKTGPSAPSENAAAEVARAVGGLAISPAEASPAEGASAPSSSPPDVSPAAERAEQVAGTSVPDRLVASGPHAPDPARPGGRFLGSGQAVWYQHPGRTASGETYDPDGLTAAHRTLPMGAQVRVVNKRNGRSVVVRINDRTPAKLRSTIDLSRGSARALGIEGIGSVALYQVD